MECMSEIDQAVTNDQGNRERELHVDAEFDEALPNHVDAYRDHENTRHPKGVRDGGREQRSHSAYDAPRKKEEGIS